MNVLLYSPDSYGLGHVRRSITLAKAILGRFSDSAALILTGAPRAHYFDYPQGCDYLKLPSVTKDRGGLYVSRELPLRYENLVRFREGIIRLAANNFSPDVLMVDHSPLGLGGEVVSTLRRLGRAPRRTLRVLGMRDVIDEPRRVRADWQREGVIDVLRNEYELILVYGQQELFDPIKAYRIPLDVARKMVFVGYIPRNGKRADPDALKARFAPRTGRLVVVALGGGGDGDVLLRAFIDGYARQASRLPFEVAAVTGPLMSPRKRERFMQRARGIAGLTLLERFDGMPDLIEAADFVVSMGGYNTVAELACAGSRALIVPRTFPRQEQLIRAQFLARRGVVDVMETDKPDPDALMRRVVAGLEAPRPEIGWGLDFGGLERAAITLETSLGVAPRVLLAAAARKS